MTENKNKIKFETSSALLREFGGVVAQLVAALCLVSWRPISMSNAYAGSLRGAHINVESECGWFGDGKRFFFLKKKKMIKRLVQVCCPGVLVDIVAGGVLEAEMSALVC